MREHGRALHLVDAVAPPLGVELSPPLHALIATESRRANATFVEAHPVPRERVHVLDGLPQACLVSAAKQHNADFLVMGAVARRGVKNILIGSEG